MRFSTQVSFAPPFWDELTTSAPSSNATRVRPPGATRASPSRPRKTYGRRSTWREASLPSTTVGWEESITMRCATKAVGRSSTAWRTASTSHGSAWGRIATPWPP